MKWYLIFAVIALSSLAGTQGDDPGTNAVKDHHVGNNGVLQPQPSAQVYHYQHYPATAGYYNYNNFPAAAYHQKQDLFGGGNTNGNNNFNLFGGDQGGDGDVGGAIGGVVAAIAALLGLKGLTKLGAAAVFIFIFVIVPLFLLPVILSIVAIALSATDNQNGMPGMMNKMKDWLNGNKQRSLQAFDTFLSSEDCIERISCAISKRILTDGSRYVLRGTKDSAQGVDVNETTAEKPTGFFTRVARGLRAENCVPYKCSMMPRYF